jgi:hypothetical protein
MDSLFDVSFEYTMSLSETKLEQCRLDPPSENYWNV